MTLERFCALLDAYGADIQRWPEAEREAARALAKEDSPALRERLAEAARVDDWLDSDPVAAPDEALVRRIEALASGVAAHVTADASNSRTDAAVDASGAQADSSNTRARPAAAGNAWRKARWLWPGVGIAGIGLAGTLAGALAVSAALRLAAPAPSIDWPERATAFSALPSDWSEE